MSVQSSHGEYGPDAQGPGRVPDELIDAVLDGPMDPARTRQVMDRLARDPSAAREVARTQRAIEALKAPLRSPDVESTVLAHLARTHGFMTAAGRRRLWATRVAAAAALVLTVGGAYAVQRFAPQAATLVHQPTPVGDVVAAVPEPATQLAGFRAQLTCRFDELPALSTLAQRPVTTCAVACAPKPPHTEEETVTFVVVHAMAPNAGDPSAAQETFPSFAGISKVDGAAWAHAQSTRPTGPGSWGPVASSARFEPMLLVAPASSMEWAAFGQPPKERRGASSPYR